MLTGHSHIKSVYKKQEYFENKYTTLNTYDTVVANLETEKPACLWNVVKISPEGGVVLSRAYFYHTALKVVNEKWSSNIPKMSFVFFHFTSFTQEVFNGKETDSVFNSFYFE